MTILVTGATANIGSRIVDRLISLGAKKFRALTKNPLKANLPQEVTAITGYLGDPDTPPAALEGAERLYLAPLPTTLDITLDLTRKADAKTWWRCRAAEAGRSTLTRSPPPGSSTLSSDRANSSLAHPDESHYGQMYPNTGPRR